MEPIGIFDLASKQAEWLTVRQSVVSGNIANANTPGFESKDIEPFNAVLDSTASTHMATTNPRHMTLSGSNADAPSKNGQDLDIRSTELPVQLANELMRNMETRQKYDLNTGLVKSLNTMMLTALGK